ncbi:hypothetical protein CCMA1212_006088 [Trichoderma ghanense]|uniref:C2H2-type domain-containing protein n=1 Tax=Trichoderma ghanense TaxID=65468 RepID=A0ABY2H2D9_9HYPO
MSNNFPGQDSPLIMDPVEFWSSQGAPKRPSSAASQRLSVRSASMDRDDPLHSAPLAQFKPPSSEARQSRVALVLKKAPAYMNNSSSNNNMKSAGSQNEGRNGTTGTTYSAGAAPSPAASSFSLSQQGGSRAMKKETPVPIPRPFGSTSTAMAAARPSSLHTPVPLPKPMTNNTKTVTQRTAPVVAPTPVPLPKQLTTTTTPAPPTTSIHPNTKPATVAPTQPRTQAPLQTPVPPPAQTRISVQIPAPAPASAPQPSSGRGRPKGWKPGMSYSSLRGPASERPTTTTTTAGRPGRPAKPKPIITPLGHAKRRGRPPKAPSPLPWQVYRSLQTSFVAFLCEWSGCKAELHNLDTLRRHVYVVHCRRKAPFICRWGACAQKSSSGCEFPDESSLEEHVEEAHLVPFSWHVGDGPRNSGGPVKHPLDEDEIPRYLMDEEGHQVTPSVRDQQVEDFATFKQNRQKLKDLLFQMNENLPSEDSDSPVDED